MTSQRPALGIALIALMALCFAAMDTAVRWLGAFLPVLLLLTVRYLVQAISMGLWLSVHPRHGFRSAHPRFQALRGSLLLVTSIFSFIGLQYVPVPELTAIYMLTPLLVTLLAATVLREPVSALRWALVAGGFVGALMVIRPGNGGLGWAILLPLAGTCCYAAFQLLTRRLAGLENPLTTHFWTGFVGAAVLLPLLLAGPVDVHGALSRAPISTSSARCPAGAAPKAPRRSTGPASSSGSSTAAPTKPVQKCVVSGFSSPARRRVSNWKAA